MADSKISGLTAATSLGLTDQFVVVQSSADKNATASVVRQFIGEGLTNAALSQQTGFAADQYLTGSSITIPTAGAWVPGAIYRGVFNMVKTAAGTAAFTITVRMGTLGTTGDASVLTLAFGAGTAAADTGRFMIDLVFRSVGSGTSAVLQGSATCVHHLAATGLISTGASGTGIIEATSAGFNSTSQTIIGLSVNGGASFSGTCNMVTADMDKQ